MAPQDLLLYVYITAQCLKWTTTSSLIYVRPKMTWREAWLRCHTVYNGTIPRLYNKKTTIKKLRECVESNIIFWNGYYSQITTWLSVEGCYINTFTEDSNETSLIDEWKYTRRPSVYECQAICGSKNGEKFAVQGYLCRCDVNTRNMTRAPDYLCDRKCDKQAYCGGSDVLTVYQNIRKQFLPEKTTGSNFCSSIRCSMGMFDDYIVSYSARNCEDKLEYICAKNHEIDERKTWSASMEDCLRHDERYLVRDKGDAVCSHFNLKSEYWTGIFRSERFLADRENKGGFIKPVRVMTSTLFENSILDVVRVYNDDHTLPSFCEVDNVPGEELEEDVICGKKKKLTSRKTVVNVTSSDVNDNYENETFPDVSDLGVQDVHHTTPDNISIYTNSTENITMTSSSEFVVVRSKNQQIELTSIFVVASCVSGVCVLLILVSVTVVLSKRKRHLKRRADHNQVHPPSRIFANSIYEYDDNVSLVIPLSPYETVNFEPENSDEILGPEENESYFQNRSLIHLNSTSGGNEVPVNMSRHCSRSNSSSTRSGSNDYFILEKFESKDSNTLAVHRRRSIDTYSIVSGEYNLLEEDYNETESREICETRCDHRKTCTAESYNTSGDDYFVLEKVFHPVRNLENKNDENEVYQEIEEEEVFLDCDENEYDHLHKYFSRQISHLSDNVYDRLPSGSDVEKEAVPPE